MSSGNRYFAIAAFTIGSIVTAHVISQWWQKRKEDRPVASEEKPSKSRAWTVEDELNNTLRLPMIDISLSFDKTANPARYKEECAKVAQAFHEYGVIIVKDPRVADEHNNRFLDMVENYFGLSDGVRDARPEWAYQVGVTPELTERPRDHCKVIGAYGPDNKPLSPCPPEFDPKWRFFWRIGPVPEKTNFPFLNAEPVIPPEFPEWKDTMDMWGNKMLDAVFAVAEMTAEGFGMPSDTFTSRMKCGPHLLAPTGSDYKKHGALGTVLAGYHYDLNFMTIHGKSRYPGLNVWTRDGKKCSVAVPDGCLLVQAGKQLEYLTGGHVLAGFHEVVISPLTATIIDKRKAAGQSLWRVSSTLFSHIQSDQILEPLAPFDTPAAKAKFPQIYTGVQVREELKEIALDRN